MDPPLIWFSQKCQRPTIAAAQPRCRGLMRSQCLWRKLAFWAPVSWVRMPWMPEKSLTDLRNLRMGKHNIRSPAPWKYREIWCGWDRIFQVILVSISPDSLYSSMWNHFRAEHARFTVIWTPPKFDGLEVSNHLWSKVGSPQIDHIDGRLTFRTGQFSRSSHVKSMCFLIMVKSPFSIDLNLHLAWNSILLLVNSSYLVSFADETPFLRV